MKPSGFNHIYQFASKTGQVTGIVLKAVNRLDNKYQEVLLWVQYFAEQDKIYKTQGKVLLKIYGEGSLFQYGDLIKAKVTLQEPALPGNFGELNYREYLARQKVFVTGNINIDSVELISTGNKLDLISPSLNYVKNKIGQNIAILYGTPHSFLIKAIILGERTEIPSEWELIFQDAGIMHILAISGLHVGIITAVLFFIFRLLPFFRRKRGWSLIITISFLLGYATLTGFRPSVARAVLMFIALLIASYINRPYHLYNSLYLAALLLLIYQPLLLLDAGFLLSFTVTFFIIFLYPVIEKKLKFLPYYISKPLAVSMAAWLGMAPLSAYYFYKISYIALLSNLLIVPFLTIILVLGIISIIISLIFFPIAVFFALVNKVFLDFFLLICHQFSSLPLAYQYIAQPQPYQIVFYYCFLILIGYTLTIWIHLDVSKKRRLFWLLTIMTTTFLFIQLIFLPPFLAIHFINVGQGDSILIQTPYQQNILIDGGGTPFSDFDIGRQIVLPYMRRLGIDRIDLMFLSHPDLDHLEGLLPVLREMKIDMVIDSGINVQQDSYLEFLSLIKTNPKIFYYQAQAGDIIRLAPDLEIIVLNSLNPFIYGQENNFNNHSIVLKLLYKNISFLFTGDIEEKIEVKLLSWDDFLKSDILKVAHHGSITSSSAVFMEKVQPEVAVISVGKNNFNHPHPEVTERLSGYCQKIFRTDWQGTILIKSDGQKYYINTLR